MKAFLKRLVISVLTFEAKFLLRRTRPQIVAVTGSVGKTSTKDAIFMVLREHLHARKSEKSFNSDIGVPLSILGLQSGWNNPLSWLRIMVEGAFIALHPGEYPKLLILEMGVDRPGDMDALTSWIHPDIVVLTRFPEVPVHVEFFESPQEVMAEKTKLVRALVPDGVLVYNQDDERVSAVAKETFQQSIGYSRYSRSPFTASGDKIVYREGKAVGYAFILTHLSESVDMEVRGSIGVQHAYNFAAAAAVASIFNISISDTAAALSGFVPQPGRMRLIDGLKQTLIIDDSYNASPAAVESALLTLQEVQGVKRRIAVLGDMMELGQFSIREHERIGALAAQSADFLVTIGVRARGYATGALSAGMSEKRILGYDDAQTAGIELQGIMKPGDVILVKGSQSVRSERIVEEIMAEPERAGELLVRQGEAWRNIP